MWTSDPSPRWRDGEAIDRTLRWPEVDAQITHIPSDTSKIYVRYTLDGIALDDVRLASVHSGTSGSGGGTITHIWNENGVVRQHAEAVSSTSKSYAIDIPPTNSVDNVAVIIESPGLPVKR